MSNPEELRPSEEVESIRDDISKIRTRLTKLYDKSPWKDRLDHVEGALTCCLVALHSSKETIVKYEIESDDNRLGPHLKFRNRGIGTEANLKCFGCGIASSYMNNISGFVASKEEGEQIVSWFSQGARLDFRPSEPNWIQVKIGACDEHLPNLRVLSERTSRYGVIRKHDTTINLPAAE